MDFEVLRFSDEVFGLAENMMTEEISTRPNPLDRVEHWECRDVDGVYSFAIEQGLLDLRAEIPARQKEQVDQRALAELCSYYKLPVHMGDLFLSELKLSTEECDAPAQSKAKILGLME